MDAIDTNVLIRLIAPGDGAEDQKQAKIAADFVRSAGTVWIPLFVLVEAACVLKMDRTPNQIAAAVEDLLDHESVVLEAPELIRAALERFRREPRIGFSDAVILACVGARQATLATFDERLGKQPGAKWLLRKTKR